MDEDELHYLLEQADRRELCDALSEQFARASAAEARCAALEAALRQIAESSWVTPQAAKEHARAALAGIGGPPDDRRLQALEAVAEHARSLVQMAGEDYDEWMMRLTYAQPSLLAALMVVDGQERQ